MKGFMAAKARENFPGFSGIIGSCSKKNTPDPYHITTFIQGNFVITTHAHA